jgi:hypothetical protein
LYVRREHIPSGEENKDSSDEFDDNVNQASQDDIELGGEGKNDEETVFA